MRDGSTDTVTPGGPHAPLGARTPPSGGEPLTRRARPTALLLVLSVTLAGYAALAADVVHGGIVSELDTDVAVWVAGSMPGWAEWLARPFTWLGGVVGATVVVATVSYGLLRRGHGADAVSLVVATLGAQVVVQTAKLGYERPRPAEGSAVDLPSSFSFPSGHAATGMATFGFLGLLAATYAKTPERRARAIAAGFGVGAAIGASRVVLNVHYVSDVLAGALLALAWLAVVLLGVALIRR